MTADQAPKLNPVNRIRDLMMPRVVASEGLCILVLVGSRPCGDGECDIHRQDSCRCRPAHVLHFKPKESMADATLMIALIKLYY